MLVGGTDRCLVGCSKCLGGGGGPGSGGGRGGRMCGGARQVLAVGWMVTRSGGGRGCTMGEQWLLKQFCLNYPVEHIQKPKLPKLYVRVETSTSYFIIHNQFVK